MGTGKARHALASSSTAEHFTPIEWIVRVRSAFGGSIGCDPATCAKAQRRIKAGVYYTRQRSGIAPDARWASPTFVNPPGDPSGKLPVEFFRKLVEEIDAGRVREFIWLAFNISQLRTLQQVSRDVLEDSCVFVPVRRIRFTGDAPTKDNAFIHWHHQSRHRRFREAFGKAEGVLFG